MDPLHGITLERMIIELVEELGWEHMGYLVPINCFKSDPSVKSSLKFLRRTPWARAKVEQLYLERIVEFKKEK
ncbi:MAG: VF530 family DNA-binding protein [Flavobacteriia bacterium]|jgi:uncharacterized protein (DUF2132 family)